VDLPLLAAAASTVEHVEQSGTKLTIQTRTLTGVLFSGPALVDGKPWPIASDSMVWIPVGTHSIEPGTAIPGLRVTAFNGELKSASVTADGIEFAYRSSARALATVDRAPRRLEIDGAEAALHMEGNVILLPRGQHLVVLR
jgi:hypothetical protein